MHWYRKGEASSMDEDKILNYWIAIENLFNFKTDITLDILKNADKSKFQLIQETISSLEILNFVFMHGWNFYHYYKLKVNRQFNYDVSLPEELIDKALLNPPVGTEIHLKKFIECLEEISVYENNQFYLNKISHVSEFYNKIAITKKRIEQQTQQIKDEILMVYRFRNLIVHNAHFDNNLLPYYVWKAREFSGSLIRRIFENFSNEKDISDILIQIYLKKEEFLFELESGNVDLFKSRLTNKN